MLIRTQACLRFLPLLFVSFFGNVSAATHCSVDLQQAQTLVGGPAWKQFSVSHIRGTIELPGMLGTFSSVIDLRTGRYFDHQKYGPVDQAQGYDGHVRWTQDTPGDVRDEDNPTVRAATLSERFDRAMAYWFPQRMVGAVRCDRETDDRGVHYAVYAVAPKNGHPFELWINAQSKRIERKVQHQGPIETVTRYADFRPVDGVLAPFLIESESSDTKVVTKLTVTERHFDISGDEAAFAKPSLHLDDYTFPPGQTKVTLKFDSIDTDVYVPVKFNGHGPYKVILDTGGSTVISPALAQEFGIRSDGKLGVTGFGDSAAALSLARLDRIEIGGVTLRNQPCAITDLDSPSEAIPLLGIVGYEVFKRLVVGIDNDHNSLTLTEPKAFQYAGKGVVVPFNFRDSNVYINASIEGINGQFMIDTGYAGQLDINGPFADTHGLRTRYQSFDAAIVGWGVGGAVHGQMARGSELRIGRLTMTEPLVRMSRNQQGVTADPYSAGTIGNGLLFRHYNVIFDYSRQHVIFEPREKVMVENDYDRSGMRIHRTQQGLFSIADVVSSGPAEQAGMRAGDTLLRVASRADWSLAELRQFLQTQATGAKVSVEVLREGKSLQFLVILRDLVRPRTETRMSNSTEHTSKRSNTS